MLVRVVSSLLVLGSLAPAATADLQAELRSSGAERSLQETLHASARDLASLPPQAEGEVMLDGGAAPRRWWPVLLSVLVPGLGEAATGHYYRGAPLLAADVGFLSVAAAKNTDGDDLTADFEAFADEHYSQKLWEEHLNGTYGNFVNEFFPNVGTSPDSVPLYVSKDVDRREWYENIGKWEVFFFGWDEYDPCATCEGYWPAPVNPVFETPLQRKYVDMRGEANDAYSTRDKFLTASILLRVFSLMQVAYLEGFVGGRYSLVNSDGSLGTDLGENLSWMAKSDLRGDSYFAIKANF